MHEVVTLNLRTSEDLQIIHYLQNWVFLETAINITENQTQQATKKKTT